MNRNATDLDLTKMVPSEIDALWAATDAAGGPARDALAETRRSIRRYEKAGWSPNRYHHLLDRQAEQVVRVAGFDEALAPFKSEFARRGGWTRFHRCTSDGGHIHRLPCHTLTPGRSSVVLLPELTGISEHEMVERVGFAACTHCFPWAPTVPAFIAGQKANDQADKAKHADRCPGSGKFASGANFRLVSPRHRCPVCQATVSVTRTGLFRSHDKPKKGLDNCGT